MPPAADKQRTVLPASLSYRLAQPIPAQLAVLSPAQLLLVNATPGSLTQQHAAKCQGADS
jgi:hypothetical protein